MTTSDQTSVPQDEVLVQCTVENDNLEVRRLPSGQFQVTINGEVKQYNTAFKVLTVLYEDFRPPCREALHRLDWHYPRCYSKHSSREQYGIDFDACHKMRCLIIDNDVYVAQRRVLASCSYENTHQFCLIETYDGEFALICKDVNSYDNSFDMFWSLEEAVEEALGRGWSWCDVVYSAGLLSPNRKEIRRIERQCSDDVFGQYRLLFPWHRDSILSLEQLRWRFPQDHEGYFDACGSWILTLNLDIKGPVFIKPSSDDAKLWQVLTSQGEALQTMLDKVNYGSQSEARVKARLVDPAIVDDPLSFATNRLVLAYMNCGEHTWERFRANLPRICARLRELNPQFVHRDLDEARVAFKCRFPNGLVLTDWSHREVRLTLRGFDCCLCLPDSFVNG